MHEDKLPACENVALTVTKKDKKYYRKLYKQRALDEKVRFAEVYANRSLKKAVSPQSVPPVAVSLTESVYFCSRRPYFRFCHPPLPSAKSFDEYVTVSPADVARFAVGSHVSIISDTSQRGYKSNSFRESYCRKSKSICGKDILL
jgi:hypothetical protein